MTRPLFIAAADVQALAADLLAHGTRVIAPSTAGRRHLYYQYLGRAEDMSLHGGITRNSLKEFFLPPTETLFSWTQSKGDVTLRSVPRDFPPQVILGAKPCDAASLPVVDKVMDWDYHDEPWFRRRNATTVVSLACAGVDGSCFCTAVGLAPDASRGADVLLVPVTGGFAVDAVTAQGETFVAAHPERFKAEDRSADSAGFRAAAKDRVAGNLKAHPAEIQKWLESHFEDSFWTGLALRCHGCGACAAVCPTCHCFDIVDEPEGLGLGSRRRNWDTCQAAKFTLHGSGHNPRNEQTSRMRQRVMHKFAIYPGRFGEVLCTGCGRCARACPGGMDLPEVLRQLSDAATSATPVHATTVEGAAR